MSPSITLGFDPDEDDEPLIGPGSATVAAPPAPPPELPVVPDMIFHFKADAITGVAHLDPLTTWLDSGPEGHDATGITTARPIYHSSGGPNNLPFLRFDGVDDMLTIPAVGALDDMFAGATFLAVVKSGNSLAKVLLQTRSTQAKGIRQGFTAGKWDAWSDPTATLFGDVSTTNWQVIKTQDLATHSWAWTIGAQATRWAGDISEMLVYEPGVSPANFNLLAAYLQAKYDL